MKDELSKRVDSPEAKQLADLQAQMLRPALDVNRDGSFELGVGMWMLCAGIGVYLNAVFVKSVWFSAWTAWLGFVPLLGGAFLPFAVPKLIKRFITWPRTGYVANPNELKLKQLVMLMIFGCALGGVLGELFTLAFRVMGGSGLAGARGNSNNLVLPVIKLAVCAFLTVYLGRKVIRKRPPLPTAYDATVITRGLKQTAPGRRQLRLVKFTLVAVFLGLPLLVLGIVVGLVHWNNSLMNYHEVDWFQLGLPSFLVAGNAVLYLMGSGVVLRPYRWKWFVLPVMLLAPIIIAPAIPHPAAQPESAMIFNTAIPEMLCIGAVWFLSGALSLILFMRHNPVPAAETS